MPPRVSVIVPTFNRLEWLPQAIGSVRAQAMPDWELILVDDGSSDGTERWARELGGRRLTYRRRDHSGSIAATRNAGIDEARGAWLATTTPGCVVDETLADIRMRPGRTTSQAGLCDRYLGKVIAYRKASRTMPNPRLRQIARRQLYSHVGTFLRRAIRHGAIGQMARVAAALGRA
jgi:glycosyltransferase involved in cell wall biosynthesis